MAPLSPAGLSLEIGRLAPVDQPEPNAEWRTDRVSAQKERILPLFPRLVGH
ncbi:hypothetical protein [Gracilibacillus sp. JCM 18860]|uniref:hypothetical protein n=1 Tax=Gracilibacillus sp. JCM 18860 TaxID=1306159 RepID=UPI003260A4B5